MWVRAMAAYHFLLSETYTKRNQTSHATFFIPPRVSDILSTTETTIICKLLHTIISCLKSILHRTNLHYTWARKLQGILLIQFWVSQHTHWSINGQQIKLNLINLLQKKKKRKIHLALGSALDPAQVYKIKTSVRLQHFLFVSGVNRLQHRSSLWQRFLTVDEVHSIS